MHKKVAVAAGLVQKLEKNPIAMLTVINLGKSLYDKLKTIIQNFGELIVVFDTYKTDSLKNTTGQNRCHRKNPVQYQVRRRYKHCVHNDENILSHVKTKAA